MMYCGTIFVLLEVSMSIFAAIFLSNAIADSEIRVGATYMGMDQAAVLGQIEYGTPKYTFGIQSYILYNILFAHYNLYTISNTDLRLFTGVRTFHSIFSLESAALSVYSGVEYHAKWFTIRPTVGAYYGGDISFIYSVDALVNIRY